LFFLGTEPTLLAAGGALNSDCSYTFKARASFEDGE